MSKISAEEISISNSVYSLGQFEFTMKGFKHNRKEKRHLQNGSRRTRSTDTKSFLNPRETLPLQQTHLQVKIACLRAARISRKSFATECKSSRHQLSELHRARCEQRIVCNQQAKSDVHRRSGQGRIPGGIDLKKEK